MRQISWRLPRRIERFYAAAIKRLMRRFAPLFRGADLFAMAAQVRRLARSPTFVKAMVPVIRSMLTQVFSDGHRNWRQAARAGSRGRMVWRALQKELTEPATAATMAELLERNAHYISNIPLAVSEQMTRLAEEAQTGGRRYTDIMKDIRALWPTMSEKRARLIARTECSKASAALTEVRSKRLGIQWYVWHSCEDERVRASHALMDGVVVPWSTPPEPEKLNHEKSQGAYHAGNIYNCRCYAAPLILYDEVSWPARVFWQGKIRTMTMAAFKQLPGGVLVG